MFYHSSNRPEGLWLVGNNSELLSDSRLIQYLLESPNRIFCIDGPSMCGKTSILKKLPDSMTEIETDELFADRIYKNYQSKEPRSIKQMADDYMKDIVCIEDVDFLGGRPQTASVCADMLNIIAERSKVILTGIELKKNIPELIRMLRDPVMITFASKQKV